MQARCAQEANELDQEIQQYLCREAMKLALLVAVPLRENFELAVQLAKSVEVGDE